MEVMWYWYQNKQINETDEELRKKFTDTWTTVFVFYIVAKPV